jgi:hypothetical protein
LADAAWVAVLTNMGETSFAVRLAQLAQLALRL